MRDRVDNSDTLNQLVYVLGMYIMRKSLLKRGRIRLRAMA